MKTKKQLLEEIKELEANIEEGNKFAALGYPTDMILAVSRQMLERAKEELEMLGERRLSKCHTKQTEDVQTVN